MDPDLLQRLRSNSAAIHVSWETLLRMEPISGPLANPDALARLIPTSVARVLLAFAHRGAGPHSLEAARADRLPACDCGNNPYLAYFVAGERAFIEAAVLHQTALPPDKRKQSDLAEIVSAIREYGRSEIDTFCTVCTHHGAAVKCRHVTS